MSDAEDRSYRVTTDLGVFGVTFSKKGLSGIHFPGKAPKDKLELRGQEGPHGRALRDALKTYATGRKVAFQVSLDLTSGTDFQQKVWRTLRDIPYGQAWTYGEIAKKIGKPKSSRAVGDACKKNPVPIILPCHRVIGSNGSMTGFGGGVTLKKRLLKLEGYKA